MQQFQNLILMCLCAVQLVELSSGHDPQIRFSSFQCKSFNPKALQFPKCVIKPVERKVVLISVYAKLVEKPLNNASVHVYVKKRGYINSPKLFEFKIDCCAFHRNKRRNPLAQITYKILGFQQYSNMNHSCPYNHDLIVDKLRIDPNDMKLIPILSGRYTFFALWTFYNSLVAETSMNFELNYEATP